MGTPDQNQNQDLATLADTLAGKVGQAEDPATKQVVLNSIREAAKTEDVEDIKLVIRTATAQAGIGQEGFFLAEKLLYQAGLGPKPRGFDEKSTTIVNGRAIGGFNPRARWG